MRKGITVIIAVLIILSVPGVVFAQAEKAEGMMDDKAMPMAGHEMMKDGMKDKGGMMGCRMMKHMMEPKVVATSDGGVVVVTGHTMTKYDQDLDVIGVTELNMDMDAIKKLKAGCPMMGQEKMRDMANEPQDVGVIEPAAGSATALDPVVGSVTGTEPEPSAQPEVVAEPAAEIQPEPAAEPAIIIEPAAQIKPATAETAAPTDSTTPAEEGNNTEQK